jgi:hypothetical protein
MKYVRTTEFGLDIRAIERDLKCCIQFLVQAVKVMSFVTLAALLFCLNATCDLENSLAPKVAAKEKDADLARKSQLLSPSDALRSAEGRARPVTRFELDCCEERSR